MVVEEIVDGPVLQTTWLLTISSATAAVAVAEGEGESEPVLVEPIDFVAVRVLYVPVAVAIAVAVVLSEGGRYSRFPGSGQSQFITRYPFPPVVARRVPPFPTPFK